MSASIINDIDSEDVQDVTRSISELATNASALAVNAIAVAKSASQLRLNEKLLTTVNKLSSQYHTNDNSHDYYNDLAPVSGFSSRATTLAPVFSNTSRISMPAQSNPENVAPAATSSGVDNSLTSISTLKPYRNRNTNQHNVKTKTPISSAPSSRHSMRPSSSALNYKQSSQSIPSANSKNPSKNPSRNQSHVSLSSTKDAASLSRKSFKNNDSNNNSHNNSATQVVYETLYADSVPEKAPTPIVRSSSSSSPNPSKSTIVLNKPKRNTTILSNKLIQQAIPSTTTTSSPTLSDSSSESTALSSSPKYHSSSFSSKSQRKNSESEVPVGVTVQSLYDINCNNNQLEADQQHNRSETLSFHGSTKTVIYTKKSLSKASASDLMHRSLRKSDDLLAVQNIAKDILELQEKYNPAKSKDSNNNLLNMPDKVVSAIEEAILKSTHPINFDDNEEIEINGVRGILANRSEIANWKGPIPLDQYKINEDLNPEIITKKSKQHIKYVQELAIRYLKPPTPPAPGEIIINQLPNVVLPPAPPIILRQQPPRPSTPEPLVIREAPPPPPDQVGRKVITISGKKLPPPPRKVVIERLAPLPTKPQSVIIERWLPYADVKRRVIYNKPAQPDPVVIPPKNVVIQWDAPSVQIKKEFKYLGVIRANPCDYVQRFKDTIRHSSNLPEIVQEIPTPGGLVLAADYKPKSYYELEGDLDALQLIDLDSEGLSEYKQFLKKTGKNLTSTAANILSSALKSTDNKLCIGSSSESVSSSSGSEVADSAAPYSNSPHYKLTNLINKIFKLIDRDDSGNISVSDASVILLRLNSRLKRCYGEDDLVNFFNSLDSNKDGKLDLEEFRKAFMNLEF